jgi:hypothetical protein
MREGRGGERRGEEGREGGRREGKRKGWKWGEVCFMVLGGMDAPGCPLFQQH